MGKAFGRLRDQHQPLYPVPTSFFSLEASPGRQHSAQLAIRQADERSQNISSSLRVDRLVINLGVWTANEHPDQRFGIYFSDMKLDQKALSASMVSGSSVAETSPQQIWQKGIDHIAGEHINVDERYVPPRRS